MVPPSSLFFFSCYRLSFSKFNRAGVKPASGGKLFSIFFFEAPLSRVPLSCHCSLVFPPPRQVKILERPPMAPLFSSPPSRPPGLPSCDDTSSPFFFSLVFSSTPPVINQETHTGQTSFRTLLLPFFFFGVVVRTCHLQAGPSNLQTNPLLRKASRFRRLSPHPQTNPSPHLAPLPPLSTSNLIENAVSLVSE